MRAPDSGAPRVSVVIPVFNNAAGLRQALDALSVQTLPASEFEVVVVDNGSSDPVRPALEKDYPGCAFLEEKRPGSYAARNRGVAGSRGAMLAFLDSDCVPTPGWLENGLAAFAREPNCGLVAGRVEAVFSNPLRPGVSETYSVATIELDQKAFVETMHFGATANLFTSREVFRAVGCFDAEMKSAGDREWGVRVHGRGYRLVYSEEASVLHAPRTSLAELIRRTRRIAGGGRDYERRAGGRTAHPGGSKAASALRSSRGLLAHPAVRHRSPFHKVLVTALHLFIRALYHFERWRLRRGAQSFRG